MISCRPLLAVRNLFSKAVEDKKGSEALEMVYSTMAFIMIIFSAMMILAYAVQVGQVAYAAKRITREIEIFGQFQDENIDAYIREFLPNYREINARWC